MFVSFPRHMYGEMAKNSLGVSLLQSSGIIRTLVSEVRQVEDACNQEETKEETLEEKKGEEEEEEEEKGDTKQPSLSDMKASILSLASIFASEGGAQAILAEDEGILETIRNAFLHSPHFSLRATCFSALGIISRSPSGARKIREMDWEVSPSKCIAVAFPTQLNQIFDASAVLDEMVIDEEDMLRFLHPKLREALAYEEDNSLSSSETPEERELIDSFMRLCGHISTKQGLESIRGLQKTHPELFRSKRIWRRIWKNLERMEFKLNFRRDVVKMFEDEAKFRQQEG